MSLLTEQNYCIMEAESKMWEVWFIKLPREIKKKITIVYAQHLQNIPVSQLEMYPSLRKIYKDIKNFENRKSAFERIKAALKKNKNI